jgi:sirohydrochlorin cobaltochelatase
MGENDSVFLLVGHGAPASDTPRALLQRAKALEAGRRAEKGPMTDEEWRLDKTIRNWPRTPETDPYKTGMEEIADRLRPRVGRVIVAYNEFCAPSLEDALMVLSAEGARDITVVTTMLTPGGVHADVEIPETLRAFSEQHPEITVRYAWPFDLDVVAALLASAYRDAPILDSH